MKPHLLDRSKSHQSLNIQRHKLPSFLKVWHYHQEIELVLILKSTGKRFVGDNIEGFRPGQLVLLGENLPHMWLNDKIYLQNNEKLKAESIAAYFNKDFLGKDFFNTPELFGIKNLINEAKRGILFLELDDAIKYKLLELPKLKGVEQILSLINILDKLSKWEKIKFLSSEAFLNSYSQSKHNRLKKVYEYVFENFQNPIRLSEVAELANMNPSAFSRFFKKAHRKTFIRYLNEIRVGEACKLLIEDKKRIKDICYDCGFNNISNFNRQFKLIRKKTPTEFIEYHNKLVLTSH